MKKPLHFFIAILTCLTISIILSGIIISSLKSEVKPGYTIMSIEEKFSYNNPSEYSPLLLSDIYIPSIIPQHTYGLKVYTGSGWHPSEIALNNPFDYSKPTVIYTHGMGTGAGIDSPDLWFSRGYNVCHFLWGAFSDDLPTGGQDKVWAKGKYPNMDKNILYYKDTLWASGTVTTYYDDVPDHSITEIYAAYYFDLLLREPYHGNEVRLYGHSLGAQLSMALTNYIIYSVENGHVPPSVLPDRITMLDPFIADYDSNLSCAWSGESMKGGSAKKALETAIKARNLGIAIEELRTSEFVAIAAYTTEKTYYEDFKNQIMYSHVATGFLFSLPGMTMVTAIERMHVISQYWYSDMMRQDFLYESGSSSYAISPFSEKEYVFARMGSKYEINFFGTENDLSDDTVTSNITTAKVGGFIFEDSNSNGLYDERAKNQLLGVTVVLLDENNNELVSMATDSNGYYSFDLELNKKYKLKIIEGSGYLLGSYSEGLFEPSDSKDLIIINIPMEKPF